MKRIFVPIVFVAAGIAPAFSADSNQSLPDSNPACTQVNGPDCVLQAPLILPRMAAPQGLITTPVPVPPVIVAPVSPSERLTATPPVITPPAGTPTTPAAAPGTPTEGARGAAAAGRSTIISPQKN